MTVNDDDGEPTLSIDSPSVAEGDGGTATLSFKVTLTPASGKPVSVAYADATTGTATSATDYAAITGGTLNFAAGDTEKTVDVTVNGDTTDELDETVVLRLSSPSNAALSGGSTNLDGTGTITDDDATTVVLARAGSGGIAEDGGSVDVTITLGRTLVAGERVTVPLAVSGATEATHYTLGLNGTGGTGVSLDTTAPHSAQHPAVKIEGASARTATLTLTAVANTDNASRTVAIAYGTGTRAPASSGLSGGIATSGSVSVPILDDDAMVSVAAASAAEGSAVVFTVTLPEVAPSGGVTVGYSTSDGRGNSADADHQVATSADYTEAAANAALSIAQGQRSGTISISTTQDSTYEGDHYFTLTLDSTSHFNLSSTADSAVGTITDAADQPSFAFSAAATDADEDDGTLTLTVEKTGTTLVAATVSYATTDGTATGGSDFTAITSTDLNFAAADTTKDITVSLTDDAADEPGEAFTVDLTAGADAQLGGTKSHAVNITDNDATTVRLAAPSGAIAEAGGSKTITVELGRTLAGDETLDVPLTFAGTASFGDDYTLAAPNTTPTGVSYSNLASANLAASPPTVSFSGVDGAASSATVVLTATADTTDEGTSESVTVGLGTLNANSGENLDGGASGSGTATFNITDDDGTPTATLVLSAASVDEDGGSSSGRSRVTATLSGATSTDVTLTVAAAPVSPAVTGDYTVSANKTLTIAAGSTSSTGTVTITATDNSVDAPDKTVTVSATASGGGVAAPASKTLTVVDDDATTVTLARGGSSSAGIAEARGTAQVTITLGRTLHAGESVTVPLTVSGATVATHFTLAVSGTGVTRGTASPHSAQNPAITIAGANARTATLTLTAVANSDRQSRTVAFAYGANTRAPSSTGLSGGIETSGSASVAIIDDDAMVTVAPASAAEGSAVVFNVSLPEAAPAGGVTIDYSTSDGRGVSTDTYQVATSADYTAAAANASITIAEGDSSGTISISTTDDSTYEGDHYFTLSLDGTSHFNLSATRGAATGTITDAADRPTFSFRNASTTVAESVGSVDLTVEKRGTTLLPAKIRYATSNGSATGGEDFTAIANTDLDFAVGDTSKRVSVSITDDGADELAENFHVRLTAVSHAQIGTTASRTVTITDNDATSVTLSAPSAAIDESGGTKTITVTLGRALEGDETLAVPLVFGGTATFGGDYTLAEPNTRPTGVTYANLASADPSTDPPTVSFSGVSNAARRATLVLTATADAVAESPSESVSLALGTLDDDGLDGGASGTGSASFEITDDTPSIGVSLSVSPAKVMEADGDMTITVTATLDGAARTAATPLTISVDPGTAQADDFAEVEDFSLTIAANASSAQGTFILSPVDDLTNEPEETVIVSGTSTLDGVTVSSATVAIRNEDPPASDLSLLISPSQVREDGGAQTVTVTARFDMGTRGVATEVNVSVAGGTATETDDFAAVSGFTITVPANQVSESRDFTFTPVNDALVEDDETVRVSATTSVTGLQTHDATLTIEDSSLLISIDDAEGVEGDFMRFRVHLSAPSPGGVRAKWFTHPADIQTAESGIDFVHDDGDVVFAAGEQEKWVEVWLIEDGVDDPWETIDIWLLEPQGAVLSDPVTKRPHPTNPTRIVGMCCEAEIASGRIFQEEPDPDPVEVSLAAAKTSVAEGGSVRVTATLAEPLRADWSPRIPLVYTNGTAEPEDHAGPALVTIFFSSGKLHGWADIEIAEDADTDDETFTVSFGEMPWQVREGTSNSVELTIIDNDGPQGGFDGLTVSIADATAYEGREDLEFAVTLNRPAPGAGVRQRALRVGHRRARRGLPGL